jgi:2-C-methyl-D-erythritol 4-phosphate cytidylyltransferase
MNIKNIVVILAGGKGLRLGYNKPKQFLKVAGKLIIEHTIEIFQQHDEIDEMVVVSHKDFIYLVEELVNKNNFNKVKKILNGGEERSDSSLVAINAYDENEDINLIFHDAVRPLLSHTIISNCIEALKHYNAIDVAVPATDTIIEVENNFISNIPNRNKLNRGQTPQAFKLKTIKTAYMYALEDKNFVATDDCGVVKKYLPEEKIYVVKGEESNIKLTYEEDLFLLDKLFQIKSMSLKKQNSFQELEGKVIVIFGGSYGIGKDIKDIALNNHAIVYSFSRSENNINIANKQDICKALKDVYKKEKKIDIVINTAGILNKESLINLDYETIEELINVNYFGSIAIAKESFKYLQETKGHLLFFTSSSYTRGRANYSLYSSSKAAIVNFTQAIASEWDIFGIKVNCINPERTLTPMRIKNFGKEDPKTLLSSKDVALTSLSVLTKNITGQVIDVKKEV